MADGRAGPRCVPESGEFDVDKCATAGMALEDALVLAETVVAGEKFEARRRPRVTFVQRQTHRRDRTSHLPPVLRNTTLRLAGRRIFHSNYRPLLAEP